MKLAFEISGRHYQMETNEPIDISIPINFNGEQPNAYGAPLASAKTFEAGTFVADTRRGGSCNVEEYRIIPHCNGTHTECVGHIALERISIQSILKNSFIASALITIFPIKANDTNEICHPTAQENDLLLTKRELEKALATFGTNFIEGLIIRTLPNDLSKTTRQYGDPPPPYFTIEAMHFINELGVQHLLVDIPSIDRTSDEGKMTAHHLFWNVREESHDVDSHDHSLKTITEMIFVPDEVEDGRYLLNLQIPNFIADAAPSRPVIFKLLSPNL